MNELLKFHCLDFVQVIRSEVSDEGIESISQLKNLKQLYLAQLPKVTDNGIAKFAENKNLELLILLGEQFTKDSVKSIAKIDSLKTLQLQFCPNISGDSLSILERLSNLEHLSISSGTPLTKRGFAGICKISKLKRLHVDAKEIPSADLSKLTTLDSLETLYLDGISINSESAQALINLNGLRQLTIDVPFDTDVTLVDKIIEQKPNCQIVCSIGSEDGTSATYYYPDPNAQHSFDQLNN